VHAHDINFENLTFFSKTSSKDSLKTSVIEVLQTKENVTRPATKFKEIQLEICLLN
jgi:hypothetical protein